MDFDLSADQQSLSEAARALLDGRCGREDVRAAMDRDGYDEGLWSAMADQGWLGMAAPEGLGGLGLGTVEVAVLLEQAGAHVAPVPFLQQVLALRALTDGSVSGEDGRVEQWVEGLLAGSIIGTGADDGTGARRALTLHEDGTVSGRPEPVVFGASASVLIVPVDPDGTGPGDELVVVDLSEVTRSPEPAMDLTRELAWIDLDHAPAVALGDRTAVERFLVTGATFHAVEMLGCADAVLTLAVDHAKQREQFGRPIGSFQAVKHRCADMLVDVEGMRSSAYHAAWAIGAAGVPADEARVAASTAKVWCSDAGLRVAESALQVHGGIGFTWESDVHLHLKRAQLDRVAFGDAAHHRGALTELLRGRLADQGSVFAP